MNRRAFLAATIAAPLAAKEPADDFDKNIKEAIAIAREAEAEYRKLQAAIPKRKWTCLFRNLDNGSYSIQVPELDLDFTATARTQDEAKEAAIKVIKDELDYCRANHLPVPPRSMMEAGWVDTGLTPEEILKLRAKIGVL